MITAFCPSLLFVASYILIEKTNAEKQEDEIRKKMKLAKPLSYGTLDDEIHANADMQSVNSGIINDEIKEQLNLFWSFIKQPIIYRPVMFIFLFMATPAYSDPMFYFYTNQLHFSQLVMGRLKLVYGIASVSGIFIYNKYLRSFSFRGIILSTTFLCIFLNMGTIVLVKRINLYLGIPDIYFSFATDALTTALGEINTMPLLVLACNICPKNIEGTLYAFLMSVSNFGTMMANQGGSVLSANLGITNSNFDNLAFFILISNLLYLAPMPILYFVDDTSYNKQIESDDDLGAENQCNTILFKENGSVCSFGVTPCYSKLDNLESKGDSFDSDKKKFVVEEEIKK